jgi:hypothetical protein
MNRIWILPILYFSFTIALSADTFKHKTSDKVFHGYAIEIDQNGLTSIQTTDSEIRKVNLSEYQIQSDSTGRNKTVSVLAINDQIAFEIETAAFEQALLNESKKGPLFILIEIDTPGGRVDLTQRLCAAISELRFCPTVAFIKGEKNLGAYSAGTAVALACDKIYMAPNTAMGAVTAIVNVDGMYKTEKDVFGETIGEKFGSAWRNYLAALAEKNNRPGILAKAMENKEIEVLEIQRDGKTLFIDSRDKLPSDKVISVFCKQGELLTLTPDRALHCGMAEGIADTRLNLLEKLDAAGAEVQINQDIPKAREELNGVIKRFNKLMEMLDLNFKKLAAKDQQLSLRRADAMKSLQEIMRQADYLIRLKQKYPDVPVDEEDLVEFKNSVRAEYESIRAIR